MNNVTQKSLTYRIVKRVLLLILAMFILSIVVFILARLTPGDPLQSYYGDQLDFMKESEISAARQKLGLDSNMVVQYFRWLGGVFHGNFGLSLKYRQPVINVIKPLVGNTILLGLISYACTFVIAIILACICAINEDGIVDKLISKIVTTIYYIPSFWLGVILVLIFAVNLKWMPSSGAYDFGMAGSISNRIRHLILPVTVMVVSHVGYYTYMIRNKLLDETRKDYVLLAKSKGCTRVEIIRKHCLRNVLPTIISLMAISIPHITGGTVVVESIFHYPGIGNLAIESTKFHDYNLLMLTVIITGFVVFLGGFIAQTLNEEIDTRIKEQGVIKW
ncbi:MAG: ABC transporter permease [Clostridiales bacterium]|nr:ABC transporter permease [Clostridiales bacterium]MDU1041522.1 ABC transporter permease [Clostridiales bacterium]MDU3489813.1 ABC transporter permease [Clostridiales bacterium]